MSSKHLTSAELLEQALSHKHVPTRTPTGRQMGLFHISTPLTIREKEILTLIAAGLTNAEIGVRLFISTETVKSHVRHILSRLGARTRSHAVYLGIVNGDILLPVESEA